MVIFVKIVFPNAIHISLQCLGKITKQMKLEWPYLNQKKTKSFLKFLLQPKLSKKCFQLMLITNCGCMEHQILFLILMTLFPYELIQDGESITKGGVGRAVAGGILFGGVGAVVGGLTGKKKVVTEIKEYALNVVTKNEFFPKILINFLTVTSTKSNSIIFKTAQANAQNIMAEFDLMIESTNSSEKDIQLSSADELRKFKNLLDDGIITQAEFDLKKKQLLEL